MANKSYLYAIKKNNKVEGICECNYEIPFVFKILVSGKLQTVPSRIFESSELIALQGDFEIGKKRLYDFLDNLLLNCECYTDELSSKIQNTKKFLDAIEAKYFYLDCSEIYDMHDTPIGEQNKQLYDEINNLNRETERFYKTFYGLIIKYNKVKKKFPSKGLFLNRKKEKSEKELKEIQRQIDDLIFLDFWTNHLYYDI